MLTASREAFAQNIAKGMSQVESYRTAYPRSRNWQEGVADSSASNLIRVPAVAARIAELQAKTDTLLVWDLARIKDEVLRDAMEVLQADAAELTTLRRLNCRFCHGTGGAYRWRDEEEFWAALAQHAVAMDAWDPKRGRQPEAPTDEGGYGFRKLAPPNPTCGRCEGEGLEDVYFADARTLRGPARRLFNGVEVKKGGAIKFHTRDKDSARALLANYAGVTKTALQVGGVLGVTPIAPAELTEAQQRALQKAIEDDV